MFRFWENSLNIDEDYSLLKGWVAKKYNYEKRWKNIDRTYSL